MSNYLELVNKKYFRGRGSNLVRLKPINDLLASFKKHIYPASGQNTVDVQRLSCFESSKKTIQKGATLCLEFGKLLPSFTQFRLSFQDAAAAK